MPASRRRRTSSRVRMPLSVTSSRPGSSMPCSSRVVSRLVSKVCRLRLLTPTTCGPILSARSSSVSSCTSTRAVIGKGGAPRPQAAGDVDTAVVVLTYADGRLATIRNSRRAPYGYDQRIELLGSEGTLAAENEIENLIRCGACDGFELTRPELLWRHALIRKERQRAQGFGGEIVQLTGDAILPSHWDAFWEFYQDTGARKWGQPYLTRRFFDIAQETLRDDMLLVFAMRGDTPVAGALNFIGRNTLYGRYWGCAEHHPCLHFELCYYQAIDFAIEHGLSRVEAGAQGEHKLARGYLPVPVHSVHWMADEGFSDAVAQYLEAEREAVDEEVEILTDYGPFRKTEAREQE